MSGPSSHPLVTRAAMTMILADADVDHAALPLAGIVDVLGSTLELELQDLTWVLHVVWGIGPPASTPPTEILVPPGTPNITQFVHDALEQFCEDWGICFDQILIETSGINPGGSLNAELWWAMAGLDCTASVDYIIDAPSQWRELPVTLGLLPADVNRQPTALLGELPEARIVRTLLIELAAIVSSATPIDDAQTWLQDALATNRFRRWLRQWLRVVPQIYSSSRPIPEPWPLDAVRLRFEGDPTLGAPVPVNAAAFGRWARAVSGRRVGVALGGAGALSYVSLPFIQQLEDAGVPIDMLSGSSTGAFAAAFYGALGDLGLSRMLFGAGVIGFGVNLAYVTNIPLTWWMAWATGWVDLSEIGQPVISVSTVADAGEPLYQTAGLAGKSMMASGSLPPFVATYIGNTRLLDGGLTDDLPSAILHSAGAELVLAAQAIPETQTIPQIPDAIPIPYPLKWKVAFNPMVRTFDFLRGYVMVFRQAAMGSEQYAQVAYGATTKFATVGSWYAGPRIAYEASTSIALQDAIVDAKLHWLAMLDDAPGRVRINLASNQVELGDAVEIGFVDPPGGTPRLTDDAEAVLVEVGNYVQFRAATLAVTLIDVPPAQTALATALIEAASGLSTAQMTVISVSPGVGAATFTLAIVP